MNIAWPLPRFIEAKHIEQVFFEDLLPLLENSDFGEGGVGAGRVSTAVREESRVEIGGESKAASEWENLWREDGGESSSVLGM